MVIFEPTLREIESIAHLFDSITWMGDHVYEEKEWNARVALKDNIRCLMLPKAHGGKSMMAKLKIVPVLPRLWWVILKQIKVHDIIHTRGPSVPAFVAILISLVFRNKKFWHKYAGNWMQPNAPVLYALQRKLLQKATHTIVTVNGNWPNLPSHIISLENPCFTRQELVQALESGKTKSYDKLTICFVGLVSASKGVPELMVALAEIPNLNDRVSRVIISGDGPARQVVEELSRTVSVPVHFTGYLTRDKLNEVYKQSHVLILPSKSEGFPKVVAEGSAFGCIPVVTNMSALNQYISHGVNGFLMKDNSSQTIKKTLKNVLARKDLSLVATQARALSEKFTYEKFEVRVCNTILKQE